MFIPIPSYPPYNPPYHTHHHGTTLLSLLTPSTSTAEAFTDTPPIADDSERIRTESSSTILHTRTLSAYCLPPLSGLENMTSFISTLQLLPIFFTTLLYRESLQTTILSYPLTTSFSETEGKIRQEEKRIRKSNKYILSF